VKRVFVSVGGVAMLLLLALFFKRIGHGWYHRRWQSVGLPIDPVPDGVALRGPEVRAAESSTPDL
jgi:hypothetical protein